MSNKRKQPFLIPDYFDGTRPYKDIKPINICKLLPLCKHMEEQNSSFSYELKKPSLDVVMNNPELVDLWKTFQAIAKVDEGFRQLVFSYYLYLKKPKNYVVSKPLSEALARTKQDIKVKHLPDTFSAYVEIPNIYDEDGDKIIGSFVNIVVNTEGYRFLQIAYVSDIEKMISGFLMIPLKKLEENDSLADVINGCSRKVTKPSADGKSIVIEEDSFSTLDSGAKIIINAVLYITCSNADLVNEINTFDSKPSKYNIQKKIYTPKPYTVVGRNFQMPRISSGFKCGEFAVTGHWRWCPCGPGRLQHKWVFIEEYTKNKEKK